MSEFKPINSSNLEAASYDFATSTLVVKFRSGAKYKYPNVSATLAANFERTYDGKDGNSAGRFFHANIRHLPSEKIEESRRGIELCIQNRQNLKKFTKN